MPHMALAEATRAGASRSSHPCTRLLLGTWLSMWPPGFWAQNIVESRFGVLPRCYLLLESCVHTRRGNEELPHFTVACGRGAEFPGGPRFHCRGHGLHSHKSAGLPSGHLVLDSHPWALVGGGTGGAVCAAVAPVGWHGAPRGQQACLCPPPQNYVSCHDPNNNAPLRWPKVPYQILGGPTENKVVFDQRNGIYIFFISIVDPYYR